MLADNHWMQEECEAKMRFKQKNPIRKSWLTYPSSCPQLATRKYRQRKGESQSMRSEEECCRWSEKSLWKWAGTKTISACWSLYSFSFLSSHSQPFSSDLSPHSSRCVHTPDRIWSHQEIHWGIRWRNRYAASTPAAERTKNCPTRWAPRYYRRWWWKWLVMTRRIQTKMYGPYSMVKTMERRKSLARRELPLPLESII